MNNEKSIKIKAKSEPIITDKIKTLRMLENLEIQTVEDEKEARIDLAKCKPSKLFNLIVRASFYRTTTGSNCTSAAGDLYPNDLEIEEHVKSSKNLLT